MLDVIGEIVSNIVLGELAQILLQLLIQMLEAFVDLFHREHLPCGIRFHLGAINGHTFSCDIPMSVQECAKGLRDRFDVVAMHPPVLSDHPMIGRECSQEPQQLHVALGLGFQFARCSAIDQIAIQEELQHRWGCECRASGITLDLVSAKLLRVSSNYVLNHCVDDPNRMLLRYKIIQRIQ